MRASTPTQTPPTPEEMAQFGKNLADRIARAVALLMETTPPEHWLLMQNRLTRHGSILALNLWVGTDHHTGVLSLVAEDGSSMTVNSLNVPRPTLAPPPAQPSRRVRRLLRPGRTR